MNELGKIFLVALIQGGTYDFAGWYLWLGEIHSNWRYYTWREWLFRAVKVILDFPVTIYVCLNLGISVNTLTAFYILKWCGFCDLMYIIIWILWTRKKMFHLADWFTWTPYGAWEYITGCRFLTNYELLAQCGIGAVLAWLVIQFNLGEPVVNWVINLIINLIF